MLRYVVVGICSSFILLSSVAKAGDTMVYGKFPVTVKGYTGNKKNSVSYSGQIARHILHDSLKKLAGKGNGKPNPALKAEMMAYFSEKTEKRPIVSPKGNDAFPIMQSNIDQLSKKKNLKGKTYKGTVSGMPIK